ncbi:MAG: transposase [Candidatus Acidiferrales bacterium]
MCSISQSIYPPAFVLTIRKRRNLPHWESDCATYFITYRLANSLPQLELNRLQQKLELHKHDRRLSRLLEKLLDNSTGDCHLARPEIASIVSESLQHFEATRYHLHAWCIMPNHIHALMQPVSPWSLGQIVHTWKSFTAMQANKLLARTGEFWHREYYDHLVRDADDFARIADYIRQNPQKAGLKNWPWIYPP